MFTKQSGSGWWGGRYNFLCTFCSFFHTFETFPKCLSNFRPLFCAIFRHVWKSRIHVSLRVNEPFSPRSFSHLHTHTHTAEPFLCGHPIQRPTFFTVYDWWYIHTAQERSLNQCRDQMESIVPCRNVHTGLRQGWRPWCYWCQSRFPYRSRSCAVWLHK